MQGIQGLEIQEQLLQECVAANRQMPGSPLPTCANPESAVIAARLSAGDPEIFGELVERYQNQLRHYLIRITWDRDLAEDILQETWMRVFLRGSQFKGESQFSTWLYAVARNLVRDHQRRKRVVTSSLEVVVSEGQEVLLEMASMEKTPFQHLASMEGNRMLTDALRVLLPHHSEILHLRFLQELSLTQISERIGVPISTVKARIHRALIVLRSRVRSRRMPVPAFA